MRHDTFSDNNELRIGEGVHPSGFAMEHHTHDCYEIGIVLGGSGHYDIAAGVNAERSIAVRSGMLLAWDGKAAHRSADVPGEPLHQIILTFGYDYLSGLTLARDLDRCLQKNPFIIDDPVAVGGAKALMRKMMHEQSRVRPGADDLIRAYMTELAALLVRHSEGSAPGDIRIRGVLSDMAANVHCTDGPEQYAAVCGLSVRRFSELFKRETGATFTQYMTRMRIEHAKALLAGGSERILSIAFESGYDSVSHFNETFKKVTGMTPTEYRGKK